MNLFSLFKKVHFPSFNSIRLYIDLGTSNLRVAIKDKGIVLKEPTYLAYNTQTKEYIFFGNEAKDILGKTPDFLKTIRPMNNGIVSDFDAEVAISKESIEKATEPYLKPFLFLKPPLTAITACPLTATEIEQKAVEEVILKTGCSTVHLIEKPLATASGCGLNIFTHKPVLIIDMGGGIIEISIISGGGIVGNKTLRNAGEYMDKVIANYVYLKHGVQLGETTSEKLKTDVFKFSGEDKLMLVRGKSLENGLPKSIKINSAELKEALINSFSQIVDATKELIELSPPEIVDSIFESGITLTGELASVSGIEDFFQAELKISVSRAKDFKNATINGLMNLDKNDQLYKKLLSLKE
ncbi:hypothetical protein COY87_00220 [Candidatus Roizmanbacteria bacterium CG_4_10_14_0_8_um_filter_33_9]|uniref:Cell shape-determining protein MreB n=1 Tax=Candidatus Roizmanbacteria bacterium CG_4_10_14_0_8_um_filter_33_9 TaxID=1974826 RepID=A0A2M7QJR1_9BACT|nr:MAG: hypothetical protein COY87_00220 [Candidatus Roizmanbacteria bacterium CG_4_10_14_0_8_um_filter_33_9]